MPPSPSRSLRRCCCAFSRLLGEPGADWWEPGPRPRRCSAVWASGPIRCWTGLWGPGLSVSGPAAWAPGGGRLSCGFLLSGRPCRRWIGPRSSPRCPRCLRSGPSLRARGPRLLRPPCRWRRPPGSSSRCWRSLLCLGGCCRAPPCPTLRLTSCRWMWRKKTRTRKTRSRCSPRAGGALLEGPRRSGCRFLVSGLQSRASDWSRCPRAGYSGSGSGCCWAPGPSAGPQCYCGYYYSCKQQ